MQQLVALRPTDGAGIWAPTAPHSRLRLTVFGTLVLCGLLTIAFVLVIRAGWAVQCRIDRHVYGHGAHTYCSDFSPVGVQP
jgi:hypothetical protein